MIVNIQKKDKCVEKILNILNDFGMRKEEDLSMLIFASEVVKQSIIAEYKAFNTIKEND